MRRLEGEMSSFVRLMNEMPQQEAGGYNNLNSGLSDQHDEYEGCWS